jgi:acid phosphatase family membrane protein YuiD
VFAVAFFLAVVVMHDAAGVRLESGKQAKAINDLMALLGELYSDRLSPEDKLKEFIGHTPLQVLIGILVGAIIAFLVCR